MKKKLITSMSIVALIATAIIVVIFSRPATAVTPPPDKPCVCNEVGTSHVLFEQPSSSSVSRLSDRLKIVACSCGKAQCLITTRTYIVDRASYDYRLGGSSMSCTKGNFF